MKFDVQIAGTAGNAHRVVELEPEDGRWKISMDGHAVDADVAAIDRHAVSVLLDGHSYTVQITETPDGMLKLETALEEFTAAVADPRAWRRRRHGGVEAQGLQPVAAPMPGKVIRVLVGAGDKVEAGQGLIVVEAMKMQNEIRSPKRGTVERLSARAGQTVTAGEVLCVIS